MKQPLDEYVARKEAADLLEINVRSLARWITRGLLTPCSPIGRKGMFFHRSDVQALRALKENRSTDIWTVKVLAMQALSTAKASEQRLLQVLEHLGLNAVPLARDEAGVQDLYRYSLESITSMKVMNPAWVRFWAGAFFMMDEVYLELVTWHTDDDEPWRRYMNFANDAARVVDALDEPMSDDLRGAYRYFDAAKRHLWHVGYMACRKTYGRRIADKVFGGAKTAVDELMAVLH